MERIKAEEKERENQYRQRAARPNFHRCKVERRICFFTSMCRLLIAYGLGRRVGCRKYAGLQVNMPSRYLVSDVRNAPELV